MRAQWVEQVLAAVKRRAIVAAPQETAARWLRRRLEREGAALARPDVDSAAPGLAAAGVGEIGASARITTLESWMRSTWTQLLVDGSERRMLLNGLQEQKLWREAIAASPPMQGLVDAESIAALAAAAWRVAAGYAPAAARSARSGSTAQLAGLLAGAAGSTAAGTVDTRTFAAWAKTFAQRCDQALLLAPAELARELALHVEHGTLGAPGEVVLVGCDELEPAAARLLEALAGQGCRVERIEPAPELACGVGLPEASPQRFVVEAETPAAERRAAVRWLRKFLAAHPQAQAALVSPTLAEERAALESELRAGLAAELDDVRADASAAPWEFAGREPLADAPVAAAALRLLAWLAGPLEMQEVTALLLSPFVGRETDAFERAAFDAFDLRAEQRLRTEVGLERAAAVARSQGRGAVAAWLTQMLAAQAALRRGPARRSFAEWMEWAASVLQAAAWPGDRPQNAQDFADLQAWTHALDAVATLDFSGERVAWTTALEALGHSVRGAGRGRPEAHAPLWVLTPQQAAGCGFDAMVVLHANDTLWPGVTAAHPLLPRTLQRAWGVPGADAAASAQQGAELLDRMSARCGQMAALYAREDEEGSLRAASAVDGWQRETVEAWSPAPTAPAPVAVDVLDDADPLPPLPSSRVRGGARVLQLQAECGFHAFADLRLSASALDEATLGMDDRSAGSVLHAALAAFWARVQSQAELRRLGEDARGEHIAAAVDQALPAVPLAAPPQRAWERAYTEVQRERLRRLLALWIEAELARGPFTVVEQEKSATVQVGPLELRVRVDRVDQVERGDGRSGTVLVDYKSGKAFSSKDWMGDRPAQPQLPLYALLSEAEELQALAFAKVHAHRSERRWLGFAEAGGILPSAAKMEAASLVEQVAAWRGVLDGLATQFAEGRADVDPREFPETCKFCAHRLLCRLESASLRVRAEAGDDQAAEADDAL